MFENQNVAHHTNYRNTDGQPTYASNRIEYIPHNNLRSGLYLVKQSGRKIGLEHYGILDVGNVIGHTKVKGQHPVVIHQTPPRVRIDWLKNTGSWHIVGRVQSKHLKEAIKRVNIALRDKNYDLFLNNCEQFARFIAEGKKYSTQLRAVGVLTALGTITLLSMNGQREGV